MDTALEDPDTHNAKIGLCFDGEATTEYDVTFFMPNALQSDWGCLYYDTDTSFSYLGRGDTPDRAAKDLGWRIANEQHFLSAKKSEAVE